jgi:hypothetical protein
MLRHEEDMNAYRTRMEQTVRVLQTELDQLREGIDDHHRTVQDLEDEHRTVNNERGRYTG